MTTANLFETTTGETRKVERAFLVGIRDSKVDAIESEEHLAELRELVDTMGLASVGELTAVVRAPSSTYLLGVGKVREIIEKSKELGADCVVVDFDLTPSQQRNWEKLGQTCVIDRQEVILEIFARRAKTREAVLQVALARLEYSLPRLKRAWTHLSRHRGGPAGTRGEGETQLEADRRIVLNRVDHLKAELAELSKRRKVQRARRDASQTPLAAIVGYTNVGKSSLLNALAGSDTLVEDKLFATLDPTTRLVPLPGRQSIMMTDTVGFIRKLPHKLVEAFKSTLEEAVAADVVVHVLDASSPCVEGHWTTTVELLEELGAGGKPMLAVFNKIDKIGDISILARLRAMRPESCFISVRTGEGLDTFRRQLAEMSFSESKLMRLFLPLDRFDLLGDIYKKGKIVATNFTDSGVDITVKLSPAAIKEFQEFL